MNEREKTQLNSDFKDYIKANDAEHTLDSYRRTMEGVLGNPYINDLGSLFSDWQGHATISMKRAFFSISALSIIQIFVFGEAFLAQLGILGVEATPTNTVRLLIVVTVSLLCSGALYLAAINRDKANRNYKATRLTKQLDAHLNAEKELREIYDKFRVDTNNTSGTFATALIGPSVFKSKYERYRNLQSILHHYQHLIKPSQRKQWLLDKYDIFVIPTIGILAIILMWLFWLLCQTECQSDMEARNSLYLSSPSLNFMTTGKA
ncbi:hypothetical protein CWE13_08805 [Aliidiomarina shirensis]|uniref:Uncharacterized protein n=1 Tax=Aliidiomarina shirensis TaxID=1048642 RepID=A0A432WT57_9GAMM|nr:hypothetical protein [Aliidiomarina shirensis]RUO36934.1 hypothetical protein CWE13_08805 [Aliidiomarina shirensis]